MTDDDNRNDNDNTQKSFASLWRRLSELVAKKSLGEWTVIIITVSYALIDMLIKFFRLHENEALVASIVVVMSFLALLIISYDTSKRAAKERSKCSALRRALNFERQKVTELSTALAAGHEAQNQIAKLRADLATAKVHYKSEMLSQFPSNEPVRTAPTRVGDET